MTIEKAQEHIGKTVRVTYMNFQGVESSRSGVLTNVTLQKGVLLLFDENDNDYELFFLLKGAKIRELKGADVY